MYGHNTELPWLLVWGKTDLDGASAARQGPAWNPLFAHSLDVAACAGELWDRYLAAPVRLRLSEAFGDGDQDLARRVVMFLAGLHDLGKASTCFLRRFGQGGYASRRLRKADKDRLKQAGDEWVRLARTAGVPLPDDLFAAPDARHELITAAHLPRLLGCRCAACVRSPGHGARHEGLHAVALLLGGHHGDIANPDNVGAAQAAAPAQSWEPVHRALIAQLARLVEVDLDTIARVVRPERPSSLPLFAGLVVLADWVGSNVEHFAYRGLDRTVEEWWADARRDASAAVTARRLVAAPLKPASWAELYPDTPEPRPFQAAALAALPRQGPALVIVEGDTGSGKTRLALACAHHLNHTNGHHGLYMAMPTRAASNEIAVELASFMDTALAPGPRANLAVVHGTASTTDIVERLIEGGLSDVHPVGDGDEGDPAPGDGRAVLDAWYLGRCRGLLSTYGIGTVDQVVLASQPSRHWFLRLFGLANKTLVIDEAHAYELFQQRLLNATVSWLADAGASVVVLSATLPDGTRRELIESWCEGLRVAQRSDDGKGPVTVVDGRGAVRRVGTVSRIGAAGRGGAAASGHPSGVRVDLAPDPGPAELAGRLLAEAAAGGIVTVIRNRVRSAHELYEALLHQAARHGWRPEEMLIVHGALLPRERQAVEQTLTARLGPGPLRGRRNPGRPRRLIVVGTRVIAQSLDIDSDRLYSDLAPIDLLIQQAGRLHRHTANAPGRPEAMRAARQTVLWHPLPDGLPAVMPADNRDGHVYAPYALAASWKALRALGGRPISSEDTPTLIAEVYGTGPAAGPDDRLGRLIGLTWALWQAEREDEEDNARPRTFHPYDGDIPIEAESLQSGPAHGRGEAPGRYGVPGTHAISRLSEPETDVVVLFQQPGGSLRGFRNLSYDAAGTLPARLDNHPRPHTREGRAAHRARARDLLLNTVSAPDRWFPATQGPDTWPTLPYPCLRRRPTLIVTPEGTCVHGPIGRITYLPHAGLYRLDDG